MSRQLLALLLVVPALAKLPDIFAELRPGEHGPMLQEGSTNAPLGVTYKPLAIGAYIIDNLQTVPGAQWPYNYYTIYYQKNMGGFNITVANLAGEVDLYVGNPSLPLPRYNNYTWVSATYFTEYVYVPDSACTNPTGCTFYAGVTPYYSPNSTYIISAQYASAPAQLLDGVPVEDSAPMNDERHYIAQWTPTSASSTYTVSVQTVSGVPILYAKYNGDGNIWPGPSGNSDDSFYGSGTLVLSASAPAFAAAGCKVNSQCNIAFTVFAATAVEYVITGSSDTVAIELVAGVPTAGYVQTSQYVYYKFYTEYWWTGLMITMTAISGDPDIFVSTTNPTPTYSNHTWAGVSLGNEVLYIDAFSNGWVSAPAVYYIGVYGFAANATFTIAAVETTPQYTVALIDGQPQGGQTHGAHTFSYYTFNISNPSDVDILASPLVNDVDLYVSLNPNVFPLAQCQSGAGPCTQWGVQPGTYDFSSVASLQTDYVHIPSTRLSVGQQIIIGVFASTPAPPLGPGAPSTFSVTATSGASMTELQNGVSVQGVVPPSMYKYYSFTTNTIADIIISATQDSGAVNIFASESARPQAGSSTWNTTGSSGFVTARTIYIPYSSLSWNCRFNVYFYSTCTIYISVQGWDWLTPGTLSLYTLSAAVSGTALLPQQLESGISASSFAPAGGFQYFLANINMMQQQTVYAVVQSYTGASDMWLNLGDGKTFAQPSNNMQADIHAPDVGGYASAQFLPPSAQPSFSVDDRTKVFVLKEASSEPEADVHVDVFDGGEKRYSMKSSTHGLALSRYHTEKVAATPYCTNCPLYVTVGATNGVPSQFSVLVQAGATYTRLANGQAAFGLNGINETKYFTFNLDDSNADITFTVNQFFGSVNAFIIVQSPLQPYTLPSAANWQWRVLPANGINTVTISHSQASTFCVSKDGAKTGPPCTFIIGVYSRFPRRESAYYSVTATTADGNSTAPQITNLVDGEPVNGIVAEGNYQYYSFVASTSSSVVVSPILIQAEPFLGRVNIYVTNQYQAGQDSSYLPSKGNTKLTCMWNATDFSTIFIDSHHPCFNPNQQTYTIGIVGASGYPINSTFQVTATDNGYFVRDIDFGVPRINEIAFNTVNANYSFNMIDTTSDITIAATTTYGNVTVMVAYAQPNTPPPSCSNGVCTGWTWMSNVQYGSGVIYIPSSNPCSPTAGYQQPAPLVNSAKCQSDWQSGRFYITVYGLGQGLNEFSVSVVREARAIQLADGQPQMILSTPAIFCPVRDPVSGYCTGTNIWQASAGFVTFTVPAALAASDQYVVIERICQDAQAGLCGQDVVVYLTACAAGSCIPLDAFPYWQYNVANPTNVTQDTFGIARFGSCYPGAPPLGAAPCVYTLSIMPQCSANPDDPPGVGCPAALVRVTWAGDTGVERVPDGCLELGESCVMPRTDVGSEPNAVRRYEAYIPTFAQLAPTKLFLQTCLGDVDIFLCAQHGSTCNPPSMPGPANYDTTVTTYGQTGGVATLPFPSAGLFYIGIGADPKSLITNPMFVATFVSGSAPVLTVPANGLNPTVTWNSGNTLTVSWVAPVLKSPGQQPNPVNQPYFQVFAFPQGSIPATYNLDVPCGVDAAYYAYQSTSVMQQVYNQYTYTFTGLSSTQTYTITVMAICHAQNCMPNNQPTQFVAYSPVNVSPPTPGGGGGGGGNGGAIAGGIIVALVVVGAGVGGFWWYKRRRFGGPGAKQYGINSAYDQLTESTVSHLDQGSSYEQL